jgi:aspartate-semialdehyde dehydrogenase
MSSEIRVGIAGATGALGKEILTVLDEAPWRPAQVIALASPATTVNFVEYGEQRIAVDDLQHVDLAELDLFINALPGEIGAEWTDKAVKLGIPVVDATGRLSGVESIPLSIPWLDDPSVVQSGNLVAVPHPAATLLAGALVPLFRADLVGPTTATVLVPASWWGRGGIDELSRQVVAMFNAGTPPRKVFPSGFAFDLLPSIGPIGNTGWTRDEDRVAAELVRITGMNESFSVTLVGVPVFSGISAQVHVRSARKVVPDLIERVLVDGGALMPEEDGPRHLPRPRKTTGEAFTHVGRIRLDPADEGFHLWLSGDNLRATASAVVGAGGAMVRRARGSDSLSS